MYVKDPQAYLGAPPLHFISTANARLLLDTRYARLVAVNDRERTLTYLLPVVRPLSNNLRSVELVREGRLREPEVLVGLDDSPVLACYLQALNNRPDLYDPDGRIWLSLVDDVTRTYSRTYFTKCGARRVQNMREQNVLTMELINRAANKLRILLPQK